MGRTRVHASRAERQRAYRCRLAERIEATSNPQPVRRREPSRPQRLAALKRSTERLKQEYVCWLESLPATLRDGDQSQRLVETIEKLETIVTLLSELQPPRGFGRD